LATEDKQTTGKSWAQRLILALVACGILGMTLFTGCGGDDGPDVAKKKEAAKDPGKDQKTQGWTAEVTCRVASP